MDARTVGIVLAAGAGTRFGGGKLLARLGGRPILQHVLDGLAAAGIDDVVVVLGVDAPEIESALSWRGERRVVNPDPVAGLSSSLKIGFEAIDQAAADVIIALGDQPSVRPEVIRSLLDRSNDDDRPIVVPAYPDDHARNPVRLLRAGFPLVAETTGDHGFGPLIAGHPELVRTVAVEGANPDVDTRTDLVEAIEGSWAARVRTNREQVERIREVPDGADFYAPVRSLFRADPTRTDDPVLDVLLDLIRSGEVWLDVGAGAGRYALPIARALDPSGGSVVALDASTAMLETLLELAEDHAIENIRTVEARWPPGDPRAIADVAADVALIAHVGYDIESIGPFIGALEDSSSRLCVAVLMERMPGAAVDAFWPVVHGEPRAPLPALPDLLEFLEAMDRGPAVQRIAVEARRFDTRAELDGFVRRQLWIDPNGSNEVRVQAALEDLVEPDGSGWAIRGRTASDVGIVTWRPR